MPSSTRATALIALTTITTRIAADTASYQRSHLVGSPALRALQQQRQVSPAIDNTLFRSVSSPTVAPSRTYWQGEFPVSDADVINRRSWPPAMAPVGAQSQPNTSFMTDDDNNNNSKDNNEEESVDDNMIGDFKKSDLIGAGAIFGAFLFVLGGLVGMHRVRMALRRREEASDNKSNNATSKDGSSQMSKEEATLGMSGYCDVEEGNMGSTGYPARERRDGEEEDDEDDVDSLATDDDYDDEMSHQSSHFGIVFIPPPLQCPKLRVHQHKSISSDIAAGLKALDVRDGIQEGVHVSGSLNQDEESSIVRNMKLAAAALNASVRKV